jgi:TonB family protein
MDRLVEQMRQAALPAGSAIVSFRLGPDGRLLGGEQVTSAGGEPFIQAASAALREAEPFPPFPNASQAREMKFRLAVEYAP